MQIMLCTYSSCDRLPCCEQGKCLVLGEQQREGMLSSKLLEASGAVTCINMYLCPHTTIRVCTCKNVCMKRHTDTDPHKMGPIPEHLAAIKWLPDITEMNDCMLPCTIHSNSLQHLLCTESGWKPTTCRISESHWYLSFLLHRRHPAPYFWIPNSHISPLHCTYALSAQTQQRLLGPQSQVAKFYSQISLICWCHFEGVFCFDIFKTVNYLNLRSTGVIQMRR